MNKNILITSAGKRVSLVKEFKSEVAKYFSDAKIYTTDMNPQMAPAGVISDNCFQVSRVTSEGYIDYLLDICINNNIKIVIPTIDTELIILAQNKDRFKDKGIYILVGDLSFISTCRDKRNTNAFFQSKQIRFPNPIDINKPAFPIFAKPYDGSLSKDIYLIKDNNDLTSEIVNHPKLMFMEYIDKNEYKEFTVDMYYGKDNFVKCIVPRERVEIRAGEINKGFTRKNMLVNYLKSRLNYLPGVVGCICIQLFYNEINNDVVGIEINPRFGGGYPLSFHAKASFPEMIIKEYLLNEDLDYTDNWVDNTLMLRFDSEVIIYEENESSSF